MNGGLRGAVFVVIVLLSSSISAQQINAIDLQEKLGSAQGVKRGRILARLTEAFCSDDPQKAIQYGQEALAIFEKNPDPASQILTLCGMAWAYTMLGEYQKAIDYNEKARQLAEKQNERAGLSRALNNLGVIAQRRGQPLAAVHFFEQSLELRKQLDSKEDIATSLNNLGSVYSMDLTDYDRGIDYHLQALKFGEELNDEQGIALSVNNLGIVYGRIGDYKKALDYLNKALELRKKLGLKQGVASTLNNIGDIYMKQGRYEKSLEINQQSLGIRKEIGERSGIATSLKDTGNAYFNLGRLDLAEINLTEGLHLSEELGDKGTTVQTLLSLAALQRKRGQYAEAEELATSALKIATSISGKERIRLALEELASAQADAGNYSAAFSTHKKFKEVNDSIFNDERARRLALLESRYELEKREREIDKLRKDQTILDLQLKSQRSQRNVLLGAAIFLGIVGYLVHRKRVESASITERLSLIDSLTGLRNRRFVLQTIDYDLASSLRKYQDALRAGTSPQQADLIFLVIDLDKFKLINDQYGHSAGDEILKQIGNLLQGACRATDTIVRWGGEEFLIISRFSNREAAGIIAERFRSLIESAELKLGEETIRCTCSIGFAAYPFVRSNPDAFTWEQVIAFANRSLVAAKRSRRNSWIGLNTTEKASLKDFSAENFADLRKWIDQGELSVVSSLSASAIQW